MADVTGVSNHFSTANEGFITTLSSTISAGATTVGLNSVAGLDDGSVFVGIIEPGEAKEQVFTGLVDTAGSQITSVVWTKGTNATHTAGVTIVDYVTSTNNNMTTKGILVEHKQSGAHSDITADSVSVANNIDMVSGKSIRDGNDNEILEVAQVASAVNHVKLTNAATGNPAKVEAVGDDTNIDLELNAKGTGKVRLPWGFKSDTDATWTETTSYATTGASFSLPAGDWLILAKVRSNHSTTGSARVDIRIQDTTNATTLDEAWQTIANDATNNQHTINAQAAVTLAATATIDLQMKVSSTAGTNLQTDGSLIAVELNNLNA